MTDKPVPETPAAANVASDFDAQHSDAEPSTEAGQPGGELFGDVVNDKTQHRKPRPDERAENDGPLRDSVKGLYDMVKDLEVQLNHMISINEAAERTSRPRVAHNAPTRRSARI